MKESFADARARIRAKVQPEVDAFWHEMEERQAADTAERNALVEVYREREAYRRARVVAISD